MQKRGLFVAGLITVALIGILVIFSTFLTPDQINPAYAAAIAFTNAAAKGDEALAVSLLGEEAQRYAAENCENGLVTACVQRYIPAEWGDMISAVFRRSNPDGVNAWDVLLVATFQEAQGFSGVCIYNRVERDDQNDPSAYEGWRVMAWSGFISCDEPNAGLSALAAGDAPNRVP